MNWKMLVGMCLCLALCGCGTVDNMMGIHGEPRVYGGVRRDFQEVAARNPAAVLDVPLSAVGDTVTLPLTVGKALRREQ